MGRRAKNKQPDPEPLSVNAYPTPKTLGKRKADVEPGDRVTQQSKPAKKSKNAAKHGKISDLRSAAYPSDDNSDDVGWEDVEDGSQKK